jgi:hypothetical protein
MPIQLSTPLNAGDLSSDLYDHVKIMRQVHDSRIGFIILELEYGTVSGSDWVPGSASPGDEANYPRSVIIVDTAYTDLITTHTTNDGELTYNSVKRGLYEFLQANYAALAGTIV